MKRKKYISLLIMVLLSAGVITACGQKHVELDLEEDTQSVGATVGLEQMKEENVFWSEDWTAVNEEGENINIKMGVCRIYPDAEQMGIMEVKEPEFDAEYKKTLSQSFFQGDVYSFSNSSEAIRKEIEFWEDWETSLGMEMYDEEELSRLLKEASSDYEEEENYEGNSFYGRHQEKNYKLTITEETMGMYYSKTIAIMLLDKWMEISEELGRMEEYREVTAEYAQDAAAFQKAQEKTEMVSQEEAQQAAEEFLQSAGFSAWELETAEATAWEGVNSEDTEHAVYDATGYQLTYGLNLEGTFLDSEAVTLGNQEKLSCLDFSKNDHLEYITPLGNEVVCSKPVYQGTPQIELQVNPEGTVTYMQVWNPVEMISVTENVSLLSLDNIQNCIHQQMQGNFSEVFQEHMESYSFSKMSLNYYRFKDTEREGYYSYIPVWELTAGNGKCFVYFNAMDGHIVNTLENYSMKIIPWE